MQQLFATVTEFSVSLAFCGVLALSLRGRRARRLPGSPRTRRQAGLARAAATSELVAAVVPVIAVPVTVGVIISGFAVDTPVTVTDAVYLEILVGAIAAAAVILEASSADIGDRFLSPAAALACIAAGLARFWAVPVTSALVLVGVFGGSILVVATLFAVAIGRLPLIGHVWPSLARRLPSVHDGRKLAITAVIIMIVLITAAGIGASVVMLVADAAVLGAETAAVILTVHIVLQELGNPRTASYQLPLAANLGRSAALLLPFAVAGIAVIPVVREIAGIVLLEVLAACLAACAYFHHLPEFPRRD